MLQTKPGDKVRLKRDAERTARGIVVRIVGQKLLVRLDGSDSKIRLKVDEVTNLSLAARKAWISMPDRQVGRKRGVRSRDRVSVTLRIDRELWERFRTLERDGSIEDRSAAINAWLRQKLDQLENGELRA